LPQWPWLVYSQLQTSVTTSRSGSFALDRANGPLHDSLVVIRARRLFVLRLRQPNRMTPPIPRSRTSRHSSTAVSIDIWQCGGIEEIGFFTPSPGQMKSGRMKFAGRAGSPGRRGESIRSTAERRGRWIGKGI
jgi:hypothetical protein